MSAIKIPNKNRKDKIDLKTEQVEEEEINFDTKVDELGLDKTESEKESKTDEDIFKDDDTNNIELEEIIKQGT
jgi:hypothetical protein